MDRNNKSLVTQLLREFRSRPFNILAPTVVIALAGLLFARSEVRTSFASTTGVVLAVFVGAILAMTWLMQYLEQRSQVQRDLEWRSQIASKPGTQTPNKDEITTAAQSSIDRLREEIEDLGSRANVNLALGCAISLAGIAFLGYFVVTSKLLSSTGQFDTGGAYSAITSANEPGRTATSSQTSSSTPVQPPANPERSILKPSAQASPLDTKLFLLSLVPRLSFVLFTELFAFFFLKLYKASLSELKYYQNEITNLEMKFLALRIAARPGQEALVSEVVKNIVTTERNFVLQKDQTTVELEKARLDRASQTELLKSAIDALKSK